MVKNLKMLLVWAIIVQGVFCSLNAFSGETAGKVANGDNYIIVQYVHSMRIPNKKVFITVDSSRHLTLQTESSKGEKKESSSTQISEASFVELKKEVEAIDWIKVGKDTIRGCDGTSVRILYGDKEVHLWTPDNNSEKRVLVNMQSLIEKLFSLAGLDKEGMPLKTKDGVKQAKDPK